MSIILKGIDLPKGYGHIHLEIYPNGDVEAEWDQDSKDYRAIQIPKGHGRLIDGGALETVFKDMAKCEWNQKASPISWAYAFEDTIDEIHDTPTILEAEE